MVGVTVELANGTRVRSPNMSVKFQFYCEKEQNYGLLNHPASHAIQNWDNMGSYEKSSSNRQSSRSLARSVRSFPRWMKLLRVNWTFPKQIFLKSWSIFKTFWVQRICPFHLNALPKNALPKKHS